MSYKVYLVGILPLWKPGTGQGEKGWVKRHCAATAASFHSGVVHPVGTGLEGFSSPPSPSSSAEERLVTHTPIRENDVDHFWGWGTWSPAISC